MNDPSFGRWSWGDYSTLSYTRGDLSNLRVIKVNGNVMEVSENLETFLYECITNLIGTLSVMKSWVELWIDALCIN